MESSDVMQCPHCGHFECEALWLALLCDPLCRCGKKHLSEYIPVTGPPPDDNADWWKNIVD